MSQRYLLAACLHIIKDCIRGSRRINSSGIEIHRNLTQTIVLYFNTGMWEEGKALPVADLCNSSTNAPSSLGEHNCRNHNPYSVYDDKVEPEIEPLRPGVYQAWTGGASMKHCASFSKCVSQNEAEHDYIVVGM